MECKNNDVKAQGCRTSSGVNLGAHGNHKVIFDLVYAVIFCLYGITNVYSIIS